MKAFILFLPLVIFTVGCSGPGGPAERAGAAVDNAVYNVGQGVENVGNSIKRSAD